MSRCWLVTGYNQVLSILGDPRFSSRLDSTIGIPALTRQMIFMDGEEHQKMQSLVLYSSAQIAKKMPDVIRTFAQSALTTLRRTGETDIVNDFASHISLMSIAHILGVPMSDRKELAQLGHWSDTFSDITSGFFSGDMQDVRRLEEYFRHLIAEKRKNPMPVSEDLLAAFVAARDIFHDDEDLVTNCMMVFSAGRVTTKKLLGNGVPLLLKHWDQLQKEFQEDARSIPKMVGEELLRTVTPTRSLVRQATEDVDLASPFSGHHLIRRGERLLLFLEAANYDPASFNAPASFDLHRRPNKHIAFGAGSHQCPGATLARLEIQIALEALFSITDLRPKIGVRPTWNPNPNLGGFISYHVVSERSS
jgi:pimeloyl-[acyl-carrier protein] synthase